VTNVQGETIAIAIEGPYTDDIGDDVVFVPPWVLERLTLSEGEEVIMEPILEALPKGQEITIRPLTGATVEGPMFLEGLTEALNQLGVIQKGILSAIVDPSLPEMHQFVIESLTPDSVCLADGELRVEIERAIDRPPTPVREPVAVASPEPIEEFPSSFIPVAPTPVAPAALSGVFVPFSGRGRRLDGKPSQ
jgi:ubiquitin fusion degradation protein 1